MVHAVRLIATLSACGRAAVRRFIVWGGVSVDANVEAAGISRRWRHKLGFDWEFATSVE